MLEQVSEVVDWGTDFLIVGGLYILYRVFKVIYDFIWVMTHEWKER